MLFKNTASQKIIVFAFDTTNNTAKTGDAANLTAYIAKDDGSVTALTDTSATELDSTNAKGYYSFDITQTETNADKILVSAKSSTANIAVIGAPALIFTRAPNSGALSIDSNGRVDVIKVAGATQTAGDIIADTNDIQSRLPAALVSGRMDSSVGAMASDVITSTALAGSAVTEIQSGLSTLDAAGVRTAVGLASANLDTQLSDIEDKVDDLETRLGTPTDLGSGATIAANLVDIEGQTDNLPGIETKIDTIDDFLDTEIVAIKTETDKIASIKTNTDQLTFSVANTLNANITHVNETEVTGTGASGDEWGPA